MAEINENSFIDVGMQISKNFLLEHVTSGAYHPIMAQWIPKYSSKIIPNSKNVLGFGSSSSPLWKIVSNLSSGAEGLLESLLNGFGGDLIVQAGFLNNIPQSASTDESKHLVGQSFDIQIKGYEDNMYNVAKEVKTLVKKASELSLVFGSTSWIHIGYDQNRIKTADYYLNEIEFTTTDLIAGITENKLSSIRGFI